MNCVQKIKMIAVMKNGYRLWLQITGIDNRIKMIDGHNYELMIW